MITLIISNFKSQITDGVCLLIVHLCYLSFSSRITVGKKATVSGLRFEKSLHLGQE